MYTVYKILVKDNNLQYIAVVINFRNTFCFAEKPFFIAFILSKSMTTAIQQIFRRKSDN